MPDKSDKKNLNLDDGSLSGLSRWIPTFIVISVVAGFFALSWYAYHAGMQSVQEEDLLIVEAEDSPLKEKPEDPGGMQFPNQDKTIFETFNKDNKPPERVERILPAPEEPMSKEMAANGDTKTWINKSINKDDEDSEKLIGYAETKNGSMNNSEDVGVLAEDKEVASETYVKDVDSHARAIEIQKQRELEKVRLKREAEEAEAAKIEREAKELAARKEAEELAKEKAKRQQKLKEQEAQAKAKAKKEAEALARAKVLEEAAKKQAAKQQASAPAQRSAGGDETVQLGAFRSEDEASRAWNKMHIKHKVLSDKRPRIVRADLGAKGIYFRLRVPNVRDGKALCATLSAAGQPCLPVKGN